jgi:peptide chain release factor 1
VAIIAEGGDEDLVALAQEEIDGLEDQEQALDDEIKLALIADPEENRTKVIFEIRAGTGGDEATLVAGDLFRMYSKFFENHRLKVDLISEARTEVGGFKEIVFGVQGTGAWRLLRFESGGHRVQRVPSTETQGRIHTSAATCAVLPEAEEVEIDIKDEELRIDTMRSSGPGGQSVNKTSSAVRITHLPTDVVVVCQDEKSQHKNKAKAMRILRARLFELKKNEIDEERSAERKDQIGSGDRSARIRTYNFPQNRLTDHRLDDTERKNFSLEQVIEGRLEQVIEALEAKDREDRLRNL